MSDVVLREDVLPAHQPPTAPTAHVAVVVSLNFPDMDAAVAELVRRFTRVALETLTVLGATFELMDTSTPLPDPRAVEECDGLLLLGGGDLDPTCYGAAAGCAPNSYGVDRRADEDAFTALAAAERLGLPVLGICRGAQLINVHRGGTIIPDIEDFALHRGGPGQPMFLYETISILEATRIRSILGVGAIVARAGHHQSVDVLGTELVAAARAQDGIVEAIEDPGRWLVGVQWHPEDDDGPADDRVRLFGAFVEAAAARRAGTRANQSSPHPANCADHQRGSHP